MPGDIILIEEGDTIPADARLIQSTALHTAEAALTGESLPVWKDTAAVADEAALGDRHNMIFSGTAATYGRGQAVVTATGMQTEMGRIAGLLKAEPEETTPLQRELDRVGKMLGLVVVVIAVVMIGTIILVENVRGFSALFDVLILGVALAVAAVPEGLPAVVTAVLALGVQRMAKRNAIVRHLGGRRNTGLRRCHRLRQNGNIDEKRNDCAHGRDRERAREFGGHRLRARRRSPCGRAARRWKVRFASNCSGRLRVADRANNAVLQERDGRWTVQGDPTEGALLVAARKIGLTDEALDARFERVGEVPFSSERKLMTTVHTDAERRERLLVFTKGAPDVLLARCSQELVGEEERPLSDERRAEILQTQ